MKTALIFSLVYFLLLGLFGFGIFPIHLSPHMSENAKPLTLTASKLADFPDHDTIATEEVSGPKWVGPDPKSLLLNDQSGFHRSVFHGNQLTPARLH